MAVRLSKGWTRLKTIGDVEPVLILVNRDSGKFGTSLNDGETIVECATLADAEARVKEVNEAGAIDALITETGYHDSLVRLLPIRVKRVFRGFARMDGTRITGSPTLLLPNPDAVAALEAKRTEHEATAKRLLEIRDEAWVIIRTMTTLDADPT